MDYISECLRPLEHKINEKSAFLGIIILLAVAGFTMFLPWASIPAGMGIRAVDGGSASGWSEGAYLVFLPFAGLFLSFMKNRPAIKPWTLLVCILVAFVLLGFNNVIHRTEWVPTSFSYRDVNYGSMLDVGFWLGFLATLAVSVFGLAWSPHKSACAKSFDDIVVVPNGRNPMMPADSDGLQSRQVPHKASRLHRTVR